MRFIIGLFCLMAPFGLFSEDERLEERLEIKNEFEVDGTIREIELENLVGTVTIETGESTKIESLVVVHAFDKEKERAAALAAKISVAHTQVAGKIALLVEYPLSEHSILYYPAKSGQKKLGRSRIRYQGREVTLFSEYTPAAVELYADVTLKLPKNSRVVVKNSVGGVVAKLFSGNLSVDTAQAFVQLNQSSGTFHISTGTGSVQMDQSSGDCILDTGTGSIMLSKCDLKEATFSTGTGPISVEESQVNTLTASTGNGRISLDDCVVKSQLSADTGSGVIKMKGDFSSLESLNLQAGSGSITFVSTPFPALNFQISTGSGRKDIGVEGLEKEKNDAKVTGVISSGSGNIKVATSKRKKKSKAPKVEQKE